MDDATSDHIEEEEDATPRREVVDAVDAEEEDEDHQQVRQAGPSRNRSARRGGESSSKKAAAAASAARSGAESERDDEAGDATPAFDEEQLGNKPLSRHDAQKLQGMASDWNMIETHLKESAFSLLTEVSTAVAEYADDNTAQKVTTARPSFSSSCVPSRACSDVSSRAKELDRLDVLMREIIDIDVEIQSHEQTLKDLHQQVVVGDEIVGRFSVLHVALVYLRLSEQRIGAIPCANARQARWLSQKDK